jgi:hypothetical protein
MRVAEKLDWKGLKLIKKLYPCIIQTCAIATGVVVPGIIITASLLAPIHLKHFTIFSK